MKDRAYYTQRCLLLREIKNMLEADSYVIVHKLDSSSKIAIESGQGKKAIKKETLAFLDDEVYDDLYEESTEEEGRDKKVYRAEEITNKLIEVADWLIRDGKKKVDKGGLEVLCKIVNKLNKAKEEDIEDILEEEGKGITIASELIFLSYLQSLYDEMGADRFKRYIKRI